MTEAKRRGRPPKNRPVEAPESPQEPSEAPPDTTLAFRHMTAQGRHLRVKREGGVWYWQEEDSKHWRAFVAQEEMDRKWAEGGLHSDWLKEVMTG